MAAHRYWRVVGLEAYDGGPSVELSEFWLLAGTTRVDAAATLAASDGTDVSSLKDDDTSTGVALARGTLLHWDFGGSPQEVTDIRIGSASDAKKFPIELGLQWSDDDDSWTEALSIGGIAWPGRRTRTSSQASLSKYRYWRLYITQTQGSGYAAVQEMELRGSIGGVDLTSPSSPASQSSAFFTSYATLAFDNNFSDYVNSAWVSNGNPMPQWISVDLSEEKAVAEVAIWPQAFSDGPTRAPRTFELQGSNDNSSWTSVLSVGDAPAFSVGAPGVFTVPRTGVSLILTNAATARLVKTVSIESQGAASAYSGVRFHPPLRALPNFFFDSKKTIGRVYGTVKKDADPVDLPVFRRVRLFRESDGLLIAETWSDAVTGAYEFVRVEVDQKYTVVAYDHLHDYRAVIADNLTPEGVA